MLKKEILEPRKEIINMDRSAALLKFYDIGLKLTLGLLESVGFEPQCSL